MKLGLTLRNTNKIICKLSLICCSEDVNAKGNSGYNCDWPTKGQFCSTAVHRTVYMQLSPLSWQCTRLNQIKK